MKFLVRLIIALVVLTLLVVVFGPALVSTGWGKSVALKIASMKTGYEIRAEKLALSWFGTQEVENLAVSDLLTCQKATSDAGLWQIWREKDVGHTVIDSPQLTIAGKTPPKPVAYAAGFVPALAFQGVLGIPYRGDIQIHQGAATFVSDTPIHLSNVEMSLHLAETTEVRLTGNSVQGASQGTFDLDGHLKGTNLDAVLHAKNFPVPSLDGKLLEALGSVLNVDAIVHLSHDALEVSVDASSPTFSAKIETQTQNGIVTLKTPARILFDQISVQVDSFSLPLADQEAFSFHATVVTPQIYTLQPLKATLSTDNFKQRKFLAGIQSPQVSSSQIQFTWNDGFLLSSPVTLGGEIVGTISSLKIPVNWEKTELEAGFSLPLPQISATAKVSLSVKTLDAIAVHVAAQEGSLDITGALKNQVFTMKRPAKAIWTFTQLPPPLPPLLEGPATVQIEIDPMAIPLAKGLEGLKLRGTLSSASIPLKEAPIQNFTASFQKGDTLSLQAKGNIAQGSMNIALDIKPGNVISAKGSAKQVPTKMLQNDRFTSAVGPTLDLTFDLKSAADLQTLSLQTSSSLLNLDLSLKQAGSQIELMKPGKITYTLTPEAYAAFRPGPFALAKPTTLSLSLTKLVWPVMPTASRIPSLLFDPDKIDLQGDLSIPEIALSEKATGTVTTLNNFTIHLGQTGNFQMNGSVGTQGKLAASGSFNHATEAIALKADLKQFPTSVLDLTGAPASALFGSMVNGAISLQLQNWTGPLSANIQSPSSQMSFAGKLVDGTLFLTEPIYIQATMTPDLSRLLLKDANPFSITALRANNPLTVEVAAQGFMIPLKPFVKSQIQIPNLRIELGQIFCENKGNLNKTIGILKLGDLSKEKTLKLWFTPIDLHVKNGLVDCERTDILVADAYHICTWGTVDLVKDYVDMILGLTAQCLNRAFGVKDLPSDYVLQIPMRGPTNNVELSTGGATAKIGALLLWQQKSAVGDLGGGGLFGQALKQLGPLPDFDSKAPPPKRPFPWESGESEAKRKKKKTSDNKKHFHPNDKPVEQILKIVR